MFKNSAKKGKKYSWHQKLKWDGSFVIHNEETNGSVPLRSCKTSGITYEPYRRLNLHFFSGFPILFSGVQESVHLYNTLWIVCINVGRQGRVEPLKGYGQEIDLQNSHFSTICCLYYTGERQYSSLRKIQSTDTHPYKWFQKVHMLETRERSKSP